jgi:hypothetical protein
LKVVARNKTLFLKPGGCENIEQAQDTKIYVENPFYLKGKTIGQTPNNSTIIKSITIVLLKFMPNLRSSPKYNNILSRN